ncbi:AAA domain-containing protein [Candidatus Thioglobus sp.]|nr:AAA domain-containing protein [Candidatus Thioglobus sp.]
MSDKQKSSEEEDVVKNIINAVSLSKDILALLSKTPGLKANEIANQLEFEVDRKDVSKFLNGNLNGQVRQDNSYKWYLISNQDRSIEIGKRKNIPVTDLARLCRYYLACSDKTDKGISTWAKSNFDDLDYGELKSLPLSTEDLLSDENAQRLLGKIRSDKSRLEIYVGYPTHLKKFMSKKGMEISRVEPLFLFPVEIDPNSKEPVLDTAYPTINLEVLKQFTNSQQDAILNELNQLETELGIDQVGSVIDIDELVSRLQNIRKDWPWLEDMDPSEINSNGPLLSEADKGGIYNKAIVILVEKSKFTKGLESELTSLSKLDKNELKGTALGKWLNGGNDSKKAKPIDSSEPLIEVLPMNSEQRQAVNTAFAKDLTIITGPPGTGKSQVVTNLLINAAWQGKKVLFASRNNKAVDVVETRVNNLGPRPILLRVGSNAYQKKLPEYLLALLSTTSTENDQFEFDEAELIHKKLLSQSNTLDSEVEKLIKQRNEVDRLEQAVEGIRQYLDNEELFLSFKTLNTSSINRNIEAFRKNINKLFINFNKKREVDLSIKKVRSQYSKSLFISFRFIDIEASKSSLSNLKQILKPLKKGLFWFLRKNGLYKTANHQLINTSKFIEELGLKPPYEDLSENNIGDWRNFINQLEATISDAELINIYFKDLDKLDNTSLFKTANSNLKNINLSIAKLGLTPPDTIITDSNLKLWSEFLTNLPNNVEDAEAVSKYLNALQKLKNTKSLEDITLERQKLFDSFSSNSENLWRLWLRLQPSTLDSEDRKTLSQYQTLLEMLMENEGSKLESSVYREYNKIIPKVSHLLPCWAATSLSVKGKLPLEPGFFDIVVFDEASQCDIASALPLLYRAKTAVVIGDPKQLSHITSLQKGQDQKLLEKFDLFSDYIQWAFTYNSLFSLATGLGSKDSLINLVDHHRSHSDIIEFSNKEFYQGRLRVATRYDNLKRVDPKEPGVRWVNVQGQSLIGTPSGSFNPKEVEAVIKELEELVINRGYKGSIGVVTPFAAQVGAIRAGVHSKSNLDKALVSRNFLVNTVHQFQGDERDVMIFSPVLSKGMTSGSIHFLKTHGNLFNVAITRARAQLIVVGDLAECGASDVDYLSRFSVYSQDLIQKNNNFNEKIELEYGSSRYPTVDNPEQVSDYERGFYTDLYIAGVKTLPQYRVEKYVLDLAIIDGDRKLNIEVDGEKYHRNWNGELCRRDQMRNQRMYELGWEVYRFWVYEIRDDLSSCIDKIKKWQENNL